MFIYIYIYISHYQTGCNELYICNERNILPPRKNIITLHYFREGIFNQWLNVFFSMIWTNGCPIQHQWMLTYLWPGRQHISTLCIFFFFTSINLLFLLLFKSVTLTATHSATTTVFCHLFKQTKTCRASSNNVCKGPCSS